MFHQPLRPVIAFSERREAAIICEIRNLLDNGDERAADELAKHFLIDSPPGRHRARTCALLRLCAERCGKEPRYV